LLQIVHLSPCNLQLHFLDHLLEMDQYSEPSSLFEGSQSLNGDKPSIVKELQRIWMNEKVAPEILPFETDIIQKIRESINDQENVIEDYTRLDEQFVANLLRFEISRIKYVLRDYYRIRLFKIEKYHFHIKMDEDELAKLSNEEKKHCLRYSDICTKHYTNSFLKFIPNSVNSLKEDDIDTKPNLDKYVFCRILENIGNIATHDGDSVNLQEGETWLLPYQTIHAQMLSGKIKLL